jgi:EF-hand domain pair
MWLPYSAITFKRGGSQFIGIKNMTEIISQKHGDGPELPPPGPATTPFELTHMVWQQATHLHSVVNAATHLFDKIDTDHSGALSEKEIKAAMKTLPAKDQAVLKDLLHAQRSELGLTPSLVRNEERAGITKEDLKNAAKTAEEAKMAAAVFNRAKFISTDIVSKCGHDGKLTAADLKAALDPSSTLTTVERKVLKDMQADLEKHAKNSLSASDLETKIRRWADNKISNLCVLNYEYNKDMPRPDSPSDSLAHSASPPSTADLGKPMTDIDRIAIKIAEAQPAWTLPPLTIPPIINLPDKTFVHKPIVLPLPQGQH